MSDSLHHIKSANGIVMRGMLCAILLLCAVPGYTRVPAGSTYLSANGTDTGIILLHGRIGSPNARIIKPLRLQLQRELGYATLALQMPVADRPWYEYVEFFPEAYRRIQAGIEFLRKEQHIERIYLLGYGMGARFGSAFLAQYPVNGINGFIGVNMRVFGHPPLDSATNLEFVEVPVLDVFAGGGDHKNLRHAKRRQHLVTDGYTQIMVPGADNRFSEHTGELIQVVMDWLLNNQ
jgi:pimeloyl-ACP methyl ester carboxylesterase